jgi:hypothetical protein
MPPDVDTLGTGKPLKAPRAEVRPVHDLAERN